jgi:hypothetical protein
MTDTVAPLDWVSRLADEVVAEAQHRNPGEKIVCASGISPSGPIHLGNFRELITPHLVADEITRRGVDCEHILSWDDYDRFRRVPKNLEGVDETWEQYIGMPLTSVPPPAGSPHANWAEHFKAPLLEAMAATGIEVRQISQTEQYRAGAYRDQVLLAMRERTAIDKVLDQYRTLETAEAARQKASGRGKQGPGAGQGAGQGKGPKLTEEQAAAATEAERGSGAATEDDGSEGSGRVLPVQAVLHRLRHRLHHRHGVRRRHARADLRVHPVRAHRDGRPRHLHVGQAGLEGRLAHAVGVRARQVRAVGRRPPEPGVELRRRQGPRADLRLGAPRRADVCLRRHRGHGQDELQQGRRPHPERRP